jgi:hypothetical protein
MDEAMKESTERVLSDGALLGFVLLTIVAFMIAAVLA